VQTKGPGSAPAASDAAAAASAPEAAAALVNAAAWQAEHAVDIRITLPLPFTRYYVTLVAGRERRSDTRLAQERRKHPLNTTGNVVFLSGCGLVLGLAALAVMQIATSVLLHQSGMAVLAQ